MDAEVFRNILFALSGLSFGSAFYALVVHALKLREDFRGHIYFALVKLAWLLTVGEVFKVIIVPISAVPPTGDGWVYMVGLAMGAVGFMGVARQTREKWL